MGNVSDLDSRQCFGGENRERISRIQGEPENTFFLSQSRRISKRKALSTAPNSTVKSVEDGAEKRPQVVTSEGIVPVGLDI